MAGPIPVPGPWPVLAGRTRLASWVGERLQRAIKLAPEAGWTRQQLDQATIGLAIGRAPEADHKQAASPRWDPAIRRPTWCGAFLVELGAR